MKKNYLLILFIILSCSINQLDGYKTVKKTDNYTVWQKITIVYYDDEYGNFIDSAPILYTILEAKGYEETDWIGVDVKMSDEDFKKFKYIQATKAIEKYKNYMEYNDNLKILKEYLK